jgi:hypothetical protein
MPGAVRAQSEPDDERSHDRKLTCLGAWLERTTQKECQAAQARSLLPASALTVGTALAAAFLSIDERWFGFGIFMFLVLCALALFLNHQRRCAIWLKVARRLEDEQKVLLKAGQAERWAKVGRHTPEQLADLFGQKEPIRFSSGPALGLYLTSIALAVLLALFAIKKDYDLLQPKSTTTTIIGPASGARAIF